MKTSKTVVSILLIAIIIFLGRTFRTSNSEPECVKVLFNFIAVGKNPERNDMIYQNYLHVFGLNSSISRYSMDCVIYSYVSFEELPDWVRVMHQTNGRCKVKIVFGYFYDQFLKLIDPDLLQKAGYDYLVLSLDDVALFQPYSNYDIDILLDTSMKYDLSVATPGIVGSVLEQLRPVSESDNNVIGRYMDDVEVQSTVFSVEAWACWYELIDLKFPSGWQDCIFYDYCIQSNRIPKGKMGVLDDMWISHNPYNWESLHSLNRPSFDYILQQIGSLEKYQNITVRKRLPTTLGEIVKS